MKETLVLYPAPSFAHLVSMVELGKLILHHHPSFSITILIPSPATNTTTTSSSSYINHISNTNPSISFYSLPHPTLPSSSSTHQSAAIALNFIHLNVPIVIQALQTLSLKSPVLAFITSAVDPSYKTQIQIPIYYYFTSCASAMAAILYLPAIHNQTTRSFKDIANTELHIPGLPPIKASDMPDPVLDRNDDSYSFFLSVAESLPRSNGIILNTFNILEPSAIKAITDGYCVKNGTTPPLYCIGPLVADAKDRAMAGSLDDHLPFLDCLSWLDDQPSKSVVFLCFGSKKGRFSVAQLKEIAIGLEQSDHRFLWAVRSPPDVCENATETELEKLLPLGFMERTKSRGFVVKSWAPQATILKHEAIGGFVTHCGWNSVVEAVSFGVPMVAWPLYAEQRLNSVILAEEMKLAIPILREEEETEGLVSASKVEKSVRELMGSEKKGKEVKERSLEMKEMAMAAWKSGGGSSLVAFSNLVASWKQ